MSKVFKYQYYFLIFIIISLIAIVAGIALFDPSLEAFLLLIFLVIVGTITIYYLGKMEKYRKNDRSLGDELSEKIKMEAGYNTFLISMFLWFSLYLYIRSSNSFENIKTAFRITYLVNTSMLFMNWWIIKRVKYDE